MQRYFFHVVQGAQISKDEEGSQLASLEAARMEALLAARELVAHAILDGNDNVPEVIIIADEDGRSIDRVDVRTVLPAKLRA
jgi:hypothetical protein